MAYNAKSINSIPQKYKIDKGQLFTFIYDSIIKGDHMCRLYAPKS